MMLREKFDKLKEEVNSDLGIFAGDLVGIFEKTSESHPEWKESLEDLLVTASQCAKMPPNDFWAKCEFIVQNLDDRRQELPMGTLKQVHTRLLFILTRCTRLVQFHKECGYEDDPTLGFHQLRDLGPYNDKILGPQFQDFSSLSGKEPSERINKKAHGREQSNLGIKQDQVNQNLGSEVDNVEISASKTVSSSTSNYKMSSWKKLPCAPEKNRKRVDTVDTTSKISKEETTVVFENVENLYAPSCPPEHSEASLKVQKVVWRVWGDQQNVSYENSLICRICEVEIPTVYVEEHSRICTIADRCDLKGLTVNERFDRVSETLEKILESWTPKSTDTAVGSPEVVGVSTRSIPEELDELPPKRHSRRCSEDMLDCIPEAANAFVMDNLNILRDVSCETRGISTPDLGKRASSGGSLTPRSPLLTPRTNQIELLLSGRRTISEHENYQQVAINSYISSQ